MGICVDLIKNMSLEFKIDNPTWAVLQGRVLIFFCNLENIDVLIVVVSIN